MHLPDRTAQAGNNLAIVGPEFLRDPASMLRATTILPADFYRRGAVELAPDLLGCLLIHHTPAGPIGGLIVETEAYRQHDDPGCHAFRGETPRNRPLFLEGGHTYVYLIYGMYHCVNLSADVAGVGTGVLIRALEPVIGIDWMCRNRGRKRLRELTRGPGRLTQSLGIDLTHNAIPVYRRRAAIRVYAPPPGVREALRIATSTRINVTAVPSNTYHWRFFAAGNPFVSASPRGHPGGYSDPSP